MGFFVYSPPGCVGNRCDVTGVQSFWRPVITSVQTTLTRGSTNIKITGTLFNGMSQGASYGDDLQSHTNYPLVRITITSTNYVYYCRTHDHSQMAVASKASMYTFFDVPASMGTGAAKLVVVANGIQSVPISVTVA
jgi:hypothetical protein